MRGVGSEKKLNSAIQLCCGHKILNKKIKQYEYTGTGKKTKFKETKRKVSYTGRIKRKVKTNIFPCFTCKMSLNINSRESKD